jgi:hypothetical protein
MQSCQFDTYLMYKGKTGNHNVYLIYPKNMHCPRDAHVGLHHPQGKRVELRRDVPSQRSLATCADEPDHETGPDRRRNHPLLRWREDAFRQQHVEENLRFCPSKPEHPLIRRKKSTGALRWRSSTPTAQDWTCIRRR